MRTRILLILSLAMALAVVPTMAIGAPAKKTRTVDLSLLMATIGQNGPSGAVFAGEAKGRPLGTAAMTARNTVSGSTSVGKAVVYAKRGTLRANITNQIEPQPDGSIRFPGTFKITGGTGRYKGATGSGDFNGTLPANSTVYVFEVDGKVRY